MQNELSANTEIWNCLSLLACVTRNHTARIELTGGEAKTSPQIAAVNIPSPTNPA